MKGTGSKRGQGHVGLVERNGDDDPRSSTRCRAAEAPTEFKTKEKPADVRAEAEQKSIDVS